ncbi:flavin reductase family protein [Streptomyces tauricus]|uniref:flavin reductase family protein n=1 Tax=Streptomyces tauricus TaxID=68274 RepID=UPI0033DB5BCB
MTGAGLLSEDTAVWRSAAGVAVLTCGPAERAHGVTVSTLCVASLRPPMVSVALRQGSRGLATLLSSGRFAANALSDGQAPLARRFARSDRADGWDLPDATGLWDGRSACGAPLLRDAVGWLECRVERTVPVGDHELVLARVLTSRAGTGSPLLNTRPTSALHDRSRR